jgi:ABC-type metal ion transport system substrate-binding protein
MRAIDQYSIALISNHFALLNNINKKTQFLIATTSDEARDNKGIWVGLVWQGE